MSAQEQRQTIIYDNIPNLIKSLTGFSEDEENFNLCLQFAESKISSHRFLSVNSHEVQRRIDGLAERFMASNYTSYATRFKELCKAFITDPLCAEHYETDVQWSVLHFLLDMSRNPVTALTANKKQIQLGDVEDDEEAERRNEHERNIADMIHSLVLVNEPLRQTQYDDSELSEWSEDDDDDISGPLAALQAVPIPAIVPLPTPTRRPVVIVTELMPPQKPLHYTEYGGSNAMTWLTTNVQHSWWLEAAHREPIHSAFASAHFNRIYGEFLEKKSLGLMPSDHVSIISEWCVLREILWMLIYDNSTGGEKIDPAYGFKFFTLDVATQEVRVNENVSLASVSTQGTRALIAKFLPYMTYSYRLRTFVRQIHCAHPCDGGAEPPHTIQCYAVGMQQFLHAIGEIICQKEAAINKQDPFEVHSIIRLFVELQKEFTLLEHLFEIHESCYLDYRIYPAHIASMYLLAMLKFKLENSFMPAYLNKVGALFITTIQYYYHILRNLWNTGRLDDWLHEFPIEKLATADLPIDHTQYTYRAKSYDLQVIISKLPGRIVKMHPSPHAILDTIDRCSFLRMMTDYCLDGAYVIDIVCNLNKLPSMLSVFYQSDINRCLQTVFVAKCMAELRQWHIADVPGKDAEVPHNISRESEGSISTHSKDAILNPVEFLGDDNPLLFMVFEDVFERSNLIPGKPAANDNQCGGQPSTAYQFYCAFNEITGFYLPIMPVIKKYTQEVLETRANIANQYILNIYLGEFDIMKHISNLRMVYLLGAGDLMLAFYSNLFKRMNAGENWSNPYLLTVQLDGILCMQYPEMASLFSIQLNSTNWQNKQPLEAIKDIALVYNVQESVRDVIQIGSLRKYNTVFQFLMQVKWAIWTLETQRFPVMFKKRRTYSPMNMFDLVFKRLALVRNWIIYSVQSIHSHLMTLVIQSMGQQLPRKIEKSKSLRELMEIHGFYIDTIYDYCFQTAKDKKLRTSIEQLLSLVAVVHDEWTNLTALDEERMEASRDVADGSGATTTNAFDLQAAVRHVDDIENAFIACHVAIADILSQEVFIRDRDDLAALSAAFTCSCPC